MKTEFTTYLKEIGLSEVIIAEVSKKYEILTQASGLIEFDNIFISEIISITGSREYFSLWGFSSTLISKISIARTDKSEIVLFKLKNNISRLLYNNYNYDLVKAKASTILDIAFITFDTEKPYAIRASGLNCDYLMKIINLYFISNLNT